MTEQEILNAIEAAKLLNPDVWRIEISMNKNGCDVNFYDANISGHVFLGNGSGDDMNEAVTDALASMVRQ